MFLDGLPIIWAWCMYINIHCKNDYWYSIYFVSTTNFTVTTPSTLDKNYTTDNCTKTLERPIDWNNLVLEHPRFDNEIFQTIANHFPAVVPACYEKRTWFENMIAVTVWTPYGGHYIISVENKTAVIHHYKYNAVSVILITIFFQYCILCIFHQNPMELKGLIER